MAAYTTQTIHPKYHQALLGWQAKNFPELEFLERKWTDFFATQTPFQLFAKIGTLGSENIGQGKFAGMPRFERAGDMVGNMFYAARDIIRAQCSTELASIQQHRLTLEEAPTDPMKVAVLRVMAEELRHAYQMFWVLDHDPTWKKPGHPDIAAETMDELLSMELGSHVLDAFNIPFKNFLDNVVFATVIDLVGKYQLDMQKVFAYAPMARSMSPMLTEEGFHIGSGRTFLRQIAVRATNGEGRFSIDDIQKTINAWFPRGVEMFGNERGGETNVQLSFKDRTNGAAQGEYIEEVRGVIELTNVAIVQTKMRNMSAADAKSLVREIRATREDQSGVCAGDLLFVPDAKFFRRRGAPEVVMQPYDLDGNLLPLNAEQYLEYLAAVLPDRYRATDEFRQYAQQLLDGQTTQGRYGW
jgi:1,2-phenylacetyl-CoA epoxidase catalytic subunit